jgi:hypothetical protein
MGYSPLSGGTVAFENTYLIDSPLTEEVSKNIFISP